MAEFKITGEVTYTVFEKYPYSVKKFKLPKGENIKLPDGKETGKITIVGNFLPDDHIKSVITGSWENSKYGYNFRVSDSQRAKQNSERGIKKFLCTVKGIGPSLADAIYKKFGPETLEILDNDISKIKGVKGIGKKKYEVIKKDYLAKGVGKQLFSYLYTFGVPEKQIGRLYELFGNEALDMVTKSPHSMYLNGYIGFEAAERISKSNELDDHSSVRIRAIVVHELYVAESTGSTYSTWGQLLNACLTKLAMTSETRELQIEMGRKIREAVKKLDGKRLSVRTEIASGKPVFYKIDTGFAEYEGARKICDLLSQDSEERDYGEEIKEAEKNLSILLSGEQEAAVVAAMNNPVSIVTGGPGTGKTSFQKVLFYVFKKKFPHGGIVLGAPTGRAARRMTESSGLPARTLHSLLKLNVREDEEINFKRGNDTVEPIKADLLVVDETSMLDIFLFQKLFAAIEKGTKVVLVGDIYQLPSVGCGAVLKSLIESGKIPVTRFTKIFRQSATSSIAVNAARMNKGVNIMQYDDAFQFIKTNSTEELVKMVEEQYRKAIKEFGVDEVSVLSPYRKKTETGVNLLNPRLKAIANPTDERDERSDKVTTPNGTFYVGDKVMYGKNANGLSNGDIGYIKSISHKDNIQEVTVDFGDERAVSLVDDDLKDLVLAYATTIHKSQGSEYKCCIIVLDMQHQVLLRRNLIYTACTRAKSRIICIGEEKALDYAIQHEDVSKRNTQLERLIKN